MCLVCSSPIEFVAAASVLLFVVSLVGRSIC